MSNYALHFTPGPADDSDHEMYVWFQTNGIHYIEGSDEIGWTEPRRLGHSTPDMNDYHHMFWMLKPEYSESIERVSMFEVQPRKDGEHGRIDPYAMPPVNHREGWGVGGRPDHPNE